MPREYSGKRKLRVVKEDDLKVDGRAFEVGDRFSFEARDAFFQKRMFGAGIYNLKNIKLIETVPMGQLSKPEIKGFLQTSKGMFDGANIIYTAQSFKGEGGRWMFSINFKALDDKKYNIKTKAECQLLFISKEGDVAGSAFFDVSKMEEKLDADNLIDVRLNLSEYSKLSLDNVEAIIWFCLPFLSESESGKMVGASVGGFLNLKK
jgi:hypothetical protein